MIRGTSAALLAFALVSSLALAQDASNRRMTRAIHAQEKEVLHRVTQRIEFDKKLDGATVKVEVQPGGAVVLSGSVRNESARLWALDLVENTTGVSSVVDRLSVPKVARVEETDSAAPVVEVARPVLVPAESRIIVKP